MIKYFTQTTTLGHRAVPLFDLMCDCVKAIKALPQPHSYEKESKIIKRVVMDKSDSATTKEQILRTIDALKANICRG